MAEQLQRGIGIVGALTLGLGSMLGTGVFVSIAIGYEASGPWVMIAIAVAAVLAMCNGLSSAQLATAHPVAGGTYEYGYQFAHPIVGFSAGWLFESAKSASAATAAIGLAGYVFANFGLSENYWLQSALALGAVGLLGAAGFMGLKRGQWLNFGILAVSLSALAIFVGLALYVGYIDPPDHDALKDTARAITGAGAETGFSGAGLLTACALMFVAYTGYGRIATLGEEVQNPKRNIPISIVVTVLFTMSVYLLVGWGISLHAPYVGDLTLQAPLESIAQGRFPMPALMSLLLTIGAIAAMAGVLYNLILGLSRVWLAMGRRGDLPGIFQKLNAKRTVPPAALILTLVIVGGLALIGDVKYTWHFSAMTVLMYYGLTNVCCLLMPRENRWLGRIPSIIGLLGCAFLAFWVEPWILLAGFGWLLLGLIWFVIRIPARREAKETAA